MKQKVIKKTLSYVIIFILILTITNLPNVCAFDDHMRQSTKNVFLRSQENKNDPNSSATYNINSTDNITVNITYPKNALYLFDYAILPLLMPVVIGPITVKAEVNNASNIDRVEFYIDGELKYVDHISPYSWDWDNTSFDVYHLKVVAFAKYGNESCMDTMDIWKFL